jgi:putative transcriptional regulator
MSRKKLKKRREEMGYSQYKIADELGMTRGGYSSIEQWNCNPSINTAKKIAKILKVKIEDIF